VLPFLYYKLKKQRCETRHTRSAAQGEGRGGGKEHASSKVEGTQGLDQGAAFLAVVGTWGNSLLVSVSRLSFVKLIIISLQQRIGALSGPMKTVDPVC